jgi:hypothetical protein
MQGVETFKVNTVCLIENIDLKAGSWNMRQCLPQHGESFDVAPLHEVMVKLVILSGDQTGESSLSACGVSEGIRFRWGRHDRGRNDSRDQVVK